MAHKGNDAVLGMEGTLFGIFILVLTEVIVVTGFA